MTHATKERLLMEQLRNIRTTVAAFCRRVPVNRDDAEQEAMIGAWKALDSYESSRGYKVWTFIRPRVMGAMLDYVRERIHPLGNIRFHNHAPVASLSALALESLIAPGEPEESDVANLLKSLAAEDRDMLTRHFIDGVPQNQIARELGISSSSVSWRIRQLLNQLRQELTDRAQHAKEQRKELRAK